MAEEKDKTKSKQQIINYILFAGILIVLFGILLLLTVISKKSWNDGLKYQIQTVLDDAKPGTYIVQDALVVNSGFATSCGAYTVKKVKDGGKQCTAAIIKITTMYGPMPAVYLNEKGEDWEFVDFACLSGKTAQQIKEMSMNSQIAYWKKRMPTIIYSQKMVNDKTEGAK